MDEAWRIAQQFGWAKTYDAEYLALAKILGCDDGCTRHEHVPGATGVVLCRYREPCRVHTRRHVDERLDGDLDRLTADRVILG